MTELKMSDVFELPFKSIDYQNGIIDGNGFGVLFGDMHSEEKEALCLAINSHDKLKQERDELSVALAKLTKQVKMSAQARHILEIDDIEWCEDLLSRLKGGEE